MEIKFTRHARRQMKWRKITEEEVVLAVDSPDRLEATTKGRKNAFKVIAGRLLRVTYAFRNGEAVVITALVKGE